MVPLKSDKNNSIWILLTKIIPVYRKYENRTYRDGQEELWIRIEKEIQTRRKSVRYKWIYTTTGIAASILLLIGCYMFFDFEREKEEQESAWITSVQDLEQPDLIHDEILIITATNEKVEIENESNIRYNPDGSVQTDSGVILAEKTNTLHERLACNQLIVPKGKRAQLYLADGTHMYVNSGSHVIYPSVFDGKNREIYVNGEIFLNVEKDIHKPFIVKTNNISVRVLGTSFNICDYSDDLSSTVVLVTGKVEVETKTSEKVSMEPEDMFVLSGNQIKTEKTTIFDHICWTENMLIFRKQSLDKVLLKLSRYYGKEIQMQTDLSDLFVNGKLDLRDELDAVMQIITSFAPVHYQYSGDIILIDKNE